MVLWALKWVHLPQSQLSLKELFCFKPFAGLPVPAPPPTKESRPLAGSMG